MSLPHRHLFYIYIVFFVVCLPTTLARVAEEYQCPIGFELAYPKKTGRPLCVRLKGPEAFEDTFKDCNGNLFNSEFYRNYKFSKTSAELWTEYKTAYPGGLFYKWTEYSSPNDELEKDIVYSPSLRIDEELCVVVDANQQYIPKSCNENRLRYCVVETLADDAGDASYCGGNYVKFWSPRATCLARFRHRVNFKRAQELCRKNGGTILHRGWRYANSPLIHEPGSNWTDPLGIILTPKDTLLWNVTEDGNNEVPDSEFNFRDGPHSRDTPVVALHNGTWLQVKDSFSFQSVTCERPIQMKTLNMELNVVGQGKIILFVNDTIEDDDIKCFTDSFMYKPMRVKVESIDTKTFEIKPEGDGYYWCKVIDSKEFKITESKKTLRVTTEKASNVYAVKVMFNSSYDFSKASKVDLSNLKKYIYKNQNARIKSILDSESDEGFNTNEVFKDKKVKRVYLDSKTMLLHVKLKEGLQPISPGTFDDVELISMKPVYYCNSFGSVPMLVLGQSIDVSGCRTYRCVGDYNEGVQVVETATEGCYTTRPPVTFSESINFTPEALFPITSSVGVEEPKPPEEQLQHIIQNLEDLLSNEQPVPIDEVKDTVYQIDNLLDYDEDLEIPGQLLHMLDRLANQADLNGSHTVSTVRNNIAVVMADTTPDEPIRGLRVAARDREAFDEDAFEVITNELNSSHIGAENTEAVVHLPLSVASANRRLSFVVFRDDRAFLSAGARLAANSRIFSVNIENVTTFDAGEVIDIYLRPNVLDVERNQSRACAFWKFMDDGRGEWSQDGCALIRANDDDVLDICRCDHLTHFAEILVSRTVFSESNETALEVLSVIGCILSMIGLCVIGLTAVLFRSWRRDFINKIWLQLCMAIFLLVLCFLVAVFVGFDHYNVSCMLIGILLHYSVLASFCWMLVAAVLSYRRLVLVFNRDFSHKLLKASAFAWGAPFAIIGVLLSINPHAYSGQFEEMAPSGSFCYPSGLALWLSVFTPIAAMLLVNWILFILIVRSVFASKRIQRHGDTNEALRCASVSFLLVFLFGLPWVFGLFASNIAAAYLFSITATFQGLVLFVFFVVGNKKTRDLWLNKLKIKQTRKVPVTSSTYTNKSSSGWKPGNGGTPADGNSSVPRSIASRDDSRFS